MHESEKWKSSRSVMSNPQRPHGLQPTRLLRPWDFPGRSTGVGCHLLLGYSYFLLQVFKDIIIMSYYLLLAGTAAKLLQSCLTLCDPIDRSLPGSPVPGILQARTLEWVAMSFSNDESEKWKWSRSVMSDSSRPHGLQPTRLLRPWDFPGKSTGVGVPLPSPIFCLTPT